MIKFTQFLFILISSISCFSQTPNKLNYQDFAKNSLDNILYAQPISLRLSIISGNPFGQVEYSENHDTTTNQLGMFSIIIGEGSVISGVLSDINWAETDYFLRIEIDADDGAGYNLLSTSQFISVPYALIAKKIKNISLKQNDHIITDELGNTTIGIKLNLNTTAEYNTIIAQSSGSSTMTGDQNTLIGYQSGQNITSANQNVFLGTLSGSANTSGSLNTFLGFNSGSTNSIGNSNTIVGSSAGQNITGSWNVALGTFAGFNNTVGEGNVFLGTNSGFNNDGSKNVFIGLEAGQNEFGSEKFILANGSSSNNILMRGNFSNGNISVKGSIESKNGGFIFPDGTIQLTAITNNSNNSSFPSGGIIMWSGDTPPNGWLLCDGTNGTPNLKGRFIVGYDPSNLDYDQPGNLSNNGNVNGKTGGIDMVTLSINQMPSHNHGNRVYSSYGGVGSASNTYPSGQTYAASAYRGLRSNQFNTVNTNEIEPSGGNESHENRPSYYVLAYIMKQ